MAKDDYFVIVYQVLKHLYDCLKKGIQPDYDKLSAAALMIPESYWYYIFVNLQNQNFVTGIREVNALGGSSLDIRKLQITPEGIAYLFDNNLSAKATKALKGFKDMVPGL